ncbi:GNAT family N-acetyltransferase [Bacteroidia bacterium]|jgi:L-amino acid N-acyltransferase YncA|nr:GNAT family N-acetyltransferase [Bacteroidia bacterium]
MISTAIREANQEDAGSIADIYNHYIENTVITFDTETISTDAMHHKIAELQDKYPVLVITLGIDIAGFAFGSSWKTKAAYKHCAETTVYIHPDFQGNGLGLRLYNALLSSLPLFDIVNAIACITIPNQASIKLHEKLGFKKIGRFDKVGFKKEEWIDVEYWQKQV